MEQPPRVFNRFCVFGHQRTRRHRRHRFTVRWPLPISVEEKGFLFVLARDHRLNSQHPLCTRRVFTNCSALGPRTEYGAKFLRRFGHPAALIRVEVVLKSTRDTDTRLFYSNLSGSVCRARSLRSHKHGRRNSCTPLLLLLRLGFCWTCNAIAGAECFMCL